MKLFKYFFAVVFALSLAACGGGGGDPGVSFGVSPTLPGNTQTAAPAAAAIELIADAASLPSGATPLRLTAVVKDANNLGMDGQTVTFSADSGNLTAEAGRVTNASGVATALLSAGADRTNRNITIRATVGRAETTLVIPVIGTKIQVTGVGTMQAGATAQYSIKLVDSAGVGIFNQNVTLGSALNNGISNSGTGRTDANGAFNFIYTANNAGTDTLVARGLGAAEALLVAVSNVDFVAVTPAANTAIAVNAEQAITVRYRVGGVGQAGRALSLSTTRGVLSAQSVTTDANGEATFRITSSSAGLASVVASLPGVGQVILPLQFIATDPFSIAVQANPGAVKPNTSGTTANQASLEAIVRDNAGNAVANRQVNFNILQDASSGVLSQSSAITDINGRASVQYVPGANSTASNGVIVRATVASTAVSGTTSLTVNGESLFISIAFGNVIANQNESTYSKPFNVYVTDANGVAVGNKDVTLRVIPTIYLKGTLSPSPGSPATETTNAIPAGWARVVSASCPNEDRNSNGSVDGPSEDVNGNGRLEPGSPVVTSPGVVRTNNNGFAEFNLLYGEQYVPWLFVRLEARATVGGTESISSIIYELEGLASDFSNLQIPPAGVNSPFGIQPSCTNPN